MKTLIFARGSLISAIFVFVYTSAVAQTNVTFHVDTERDTLTISPFIYGSNGQSDDTSVHIAARRLGGNRLTGYNWETNASNAGTDYLNHSDDYLVSTLPQVEANVPAIVPISFHRESLAEHAYTLFTLPAAGYAAADEAGTVDASQTAPSSRWCTVLPFRGSAFPASPVTNDGVVAVDEEVHYIVGQIGNSTHEGIRGYACDNEPALWPLTHPRIHPNATTCAEVISRDSAVALAVKSIDPTAEVFGPVSYGFEEFLNNQQAPDFLQYQSYGRWLDAYLAKMNVASNRAGKRLIDVLDIHWYPEAQGLSANGTLTRISGSDNDDAGIARARMDAARSLWDSTYKENSWISQYYSPVALIRWLNASIAKNNPGTKLAFTEWNYGGDTHISGAVAAADVLGVYGRYGVYMANYWGSVTSYIASAFKLYRNYDNDNHSFGDFSVRATTSNIDSTSIYAARRTNDASHLDVMVINKSLTATQHATITITSPKSYTSGELFIVQRGLTAISAAPIIKNIANNIFTYDLPPTSVLHFVLQADASGVSASNAPIFTLTATQVSHELRLTLTRPLTTAANIAVRDALGRVVLEAPMPAGRASSSLNAASLASGVYFVSLASPNERAATKVLLER